MTALVNEDDPLRITAKCRALLQGAYVQITVAMQLIDHLEQQLEDQQ